ncbi:MAG: class I SAM-dependent methyltransferase [Deltaproteobacteria bacterium]|nr:class I SAM-dependent methyltransferase [Deltaproteobacteria bacterium]
MSARLDKIEGDREGFDENWKKRDETTYIHWTRGEPKNQIQLAFRNHWDLFNEIMGKDFSGRRALEVGCGRGSMSAYFADNDFDCTLLDYSAEAIETAKRIFAAHKLNAKFDVGDALDLPYEDNSFDVIYSIGLLEHFEDIEKLLSEQIRVLDSKGLFLGYVVPHYNENVQKDYKWINDLLKTYAEKQSDQNIPKKADIFRSDYGSERYIDVLNKLPVNNISASGVYPLPMISHSIEFPFTLLAENQEAILIDRFNKMLAERKTQNPNQHPWLCEEGYGQAFLLWCFKN